MSHITGKEYFRQADTCRKYLFHYLKFSPNVNDNYYKEDLEEFRLQLLEDIRQIITPKEAKLVKTWAKECGGNEVA